MFICSLPIDKGMARNYRPVGNLFNFVKLHGFALDFLSKGIFKVHYCYILFCEKKHSNKVKHPFLFLELFLCFCYVIFTFMRPQTAWRGESISSITFHDYFLIYLGYFVLN